MAWYHPKTIFDNVFEIGIIFKGVDGALELIAGILLLFVKPDTIQDFVTVITQKELLEDPHDLVANLLVHSSQHLTSGATLFATIYLLVHGVIKLVAVGGIFLKQLWAYPFSLITLSALLLFQIYSIIQSPSVGLIALSIIDAVILWLIWREYRIIKREGFKHDKRSVQNNASSPS